ncbi:MAG TPA: hypothetical protein VIX42_09480 [Edaphobacter sp.]
MTEHKPLHEAENLSRFTFALAFACALIFLYLRTFLLPATPLVAGGDQILFFVHGLRLAHGQMLYRDFFELITPGTDLLYATTFRIFGVHAWIMQAWCIALGLALACVITRIASRMFRGPIVLLPGLLFVVLNFDTAADPTHHWYSTLFALVAVSVLTDGAGVPRICIAGALCGVATLFTQTQGALAFVAIAIYLVWFRRFEGEDRSIAVRLAALGVPFILIVGSVLGYYAYLVGVRTLFFDLVVFPLRFLSSGDVNSPRTYLHQFPSVHRLADVIRLIPFMFVYILVPYVYFFGLYEQWRRREEISGTLRQHIVLLNLVGLGLFLAVVNGPRFFRLSTVAPPAILICVWVLSYRTPARRVALKLLCLLAIFFALLLPVYRQIQSHVILGLPIGRTAFINIQEANEFEWLAERTRPSELFFNQSALALYLSLDNPTASEFVNDDDFTRPEQVVAVIQSLQWHPPHFIVLYPEGKTPLNIHDHSAPFRRYVHDNYRLVQIFPLQNNSRYEELWEFDRRSDR